MRIPVNELRPGDTINQVFMVRDRQFNTTKAGQPFAKVVLCDATGNIVSIVWDVPPAAIKVLENSKFVSVRGSVGTYQNSPQVKIDFLEAADPDGIDIADFLPVTEKNVAEMFKGLKRTLSAVGNPQLLAFIREIFTDKALCDKLKRAPAASQMHHAYIGGLLEHTESMAGAAVKLSEHYTNLNLDLLLVGVLIHDLGKIEEFSYDTHIQYSDSGRLVGHVAIGIRIVEEKAAAVEGFPPALLDLLRHFILSHHGVPEFGAIRRPMTAEAMALHYIDNLDAKLAAYFKATTEHPVSSDNWTAFERMFDTYLFRGDVFSGQGGAQGEGGESEGESEGEAQGLF